MTAKRPSSPSNLFRNATTDPVGTEEEARKKAKEEADAVAVALQVLARAVEAAKPPAEEQLPLASTTPPTPAIVVPATRPRR